VITKINHSCWLSIATVTFIRTHPPNISAPIFYVFSFPPQLSMTLNPHLIQLVLAWQLNGINQSEFLKLFLLIRFSCSFASVGRFSSLDICLCLAVTPGRPLEERLLLCLWAFCKKHPDCYGFKIALSARKISLPADKKSLSHSRFYHTKIKNFCRTKCI